MDYKKEVIKSQTDLKKILVDNEKLIVKAKFGPSQLTSIPLKLDEELSFFTASIIGDGHLRKSKKQIVLEVNDKKITSILKNICINLFDREFNIKNRIENHKGIRERFKIIIDSKAIFNLLNIVFEIPAGKKSNIVEVPQIIKVSNIKIKSSFLAGIMITEGGNRKRGYGLSTSSKKLWVDLIILFNDVGIIVKKDRWIYKKYNKEYYGIYFDKEEINKIINSCDDNTIKNIMKDKFIRTNI